MKLKHYAQGPVEFDRTRRYAQRRPIGGIKPAGFWVSVDGEDDCPWPAYLHEWGEPLGQWAYRVELDPDARIRHISSPQGIDLFHEAYAVQTSFEREYQIRHDSWPIDWTAVAEDYDGVIIAPYQWVRRMNPHWYYNWDCSSGCLFTPEAVRSLQLVARPALYAWSDRG